MLIRGGNLRRYGLSQAFKWIFAIFLIYMCFLYIWKFKKATVPDEQSARQPVMIPRARRVQMALNVSGNNTNYFAQNSNSSDNITNSDDVIAVLVFCATREKAIRNHLEQLLSQRPDAQKFPIYVSQDSDSSEVQQTVKELVNKSKNVFYMQHPRQTPKTSSQKNAKNYFYISQHYKWALGEIFKKHSTIIITEDDLDIANDFFNYFSSTKKLLDQDPSLFCISAWNDNGGSAVIDRTRGDLLYRTDFFPGLGWMIKADVGKQLLPDWPDAYWDDWLRRPEIRKNRACIRPEITRTAHNNRLAGKGSSGGMYKSYLASIQLPDSPVDFSLVDMSRMQKRSYDSTFRQNILDAKPIEISALIEQKDMSSEFAYRVTYNNPREFRQIADKFKLMNDFRGGMTRTAYYGIVTFTTNKTRVYIVPKKLDLTRDFSQYNSEEIYLLDWDLMNHFLDFQSTYCKPGKWTGKCDPEDPEMRAWFERKRMVKRLQAWGKMIVC